MTRINLVNVQDLSQQHLVSEYRELPRVFGLVRKAQSRGLSPRNLIRPYAYTMGMGHVTFFYDKLRFLTLRQYLLIQEMQRREYTTSNTSLVELCQGLDEHWFGDYFPTPEALDISRSRLIMKRPDFYLGKEWL